jgi:hypothetical protein
MTLGTCARCPAQAVRTLGMAALCGDCVERILAPIRARVLERDMLQETTHGRGQQFGLMQPDYGPTCADLRCDQCSATWVGNPGDPCWWCWRRYQAMVEGTAALVLAPPDVDPDDRTYPQVLIAWGERLNRAIEAGLISVEEASNAYRKAVGRERAA